MEISQRSLYSFNESFSIDPAIVPAQDIEHFENLLNRIR